MGLFSLCCGGAGATTKGDEQAPLWAPPGEQRRRKGGSGGAAAGPGLAFGQGALRYDPFASSYDTQRKKAARADEPNPFAYEAPLVAPSDDPFAPSQQAAAGGWSAEPGYLKEQALLVAQEAGTESPPADKHWFGLGRSSSPSPPPAAAPQPSRARQRQPAGQQRAPAFGEGALTKWH